MMRLVLVAATSTAMVCAASTSAIAQDVFGRSGLYDATGSDVVRGHRLDYAHLHHVRPRFAAPGAPGSGTVEIRRNYVYVQDSDGTLVIPPMSSMDLFNWFNFALQDLYSVLPDEFVFVYLFTSFDTHIGAFFYQPEANDTLGIGDTIYDMNGSSPRDGFVFMNFWQVFNQVFGQFGQDVADGQARSVFNQEAAHRWAAYVQAGTAGMGQGTDVLRGRDNAHWSYFLDTSASPMEGNHWRDNGGGSFTTLTTAQNWRYSDLDLYLMGVKTATSVMPFFVVDAPVVGNQTDLRMMPISRASTPQVQEIGGSVTVTGHRVNFTINDIIARNGARNPAFGHAPRRWRVAFVMLAGKTSGMTEAQKTSFETMVDFYAGGFKEGTGGLGEFDYHQNPTPRMPIGGACTKMEECDALQANVCLVVPPVPSGQGLCTRACMSGTSCPMDWCCQADSVGVRVCLPPELCQPEVPDAGLLPDAGEIDGDSAGTSPMDGSVDGGAAQPAQAKSGCASVEAHRDGWSAWPFFFLALFFLQRSTKKRRIE